MWAVISDKGRSRWPGNRAKEHEPRLAREGREDVLLQEEERIKEEHRVNGKPRRVFWEKPPPEETKALDNNLSHKAPKNWISPTLEQ